MRLLVILLIALAGLLWTLRSGEVDPGPGAVAPDAPEQSAADSERAFQHKGYRIKPLADIELTARVLSREDYRLGRESDLSPTDLALGWGEMSDSEVLQHISFSQSGRWYYWRAERLPIPRRDIETQSANMHMIPADEIVARDLDKIRQGDVVSITGRLVRVDAEDGWQWISSLTRNDTGARACELIWIEELEVH